MYHKFVVNMKSEDKINKHKILLLQLNNKSYIEIILHDLVDEILRQASIQRFLIELC